MSIELNNLCFSRAGQHIVNDVSGAFRQGKVTAIVGPNGSGKTSLLKLLSGNVAPTSGQVCLQGSNLNRLTNQALARQLAILPQSSPRPLGMTVYDVVACGRYPYTGTWKPFSPNDRKAVIAALCKADLLTIKDQPVDHLSGGEMQRVWLAMVLCQQTEYLLLDEPISYLDVAHQMALLEIVQSLNKEEGITIIWVLHDLNHALQYSDDIWVMQRGELVCSGSARDTLNMALLQSVFGIDTTSIHSPDLSAPIIVPTRLHQSQPSPVDSPEKAVSESRENPLFSAEAG